jgi:acyl-coenzyme A synthetase/AMP-(fatty) acid ligase
MSDNDFWQEFRTQARLRPNAPALAWREETITYRELAELADKAQATLDQLDLEPGEPVALLTGKSPGAIALILACLTVGRPFLLPSPSLAESSLSQLFAQAGCRYVLTPGIEPALAEADPEARARARRISPDEGVCFMLTTSGSTGLPKIVPLGREAVNRFTAWASEAFDIRPGTVVLNYAPLNFDLCLLDVWTTLAHGGKVVLVDADKAASGRYLMDLIVQHRADVIQAVPMCFSLLLDAADQAGVKFGFTGHVLFTGDVMPDKTLTEMPRIFTTARLYNVYGCTETNDSLVFEVDPTSPVGSPLPIGYPLPGVEILIAGQEEEGELFVSTPFQTAGYLDDARNEGRFGTHPQGLAGRVYFRSGDLVRRGPNGELYLLGRNDFQVKIRGVAINTAEVERVLLEHPDVLEAAVVALPDPLAGKQLACAVTRAPQSRLNSLVLREHCARRLPLAAVPSVMTITDSPLPKTSTGKVDRSAIKGRTS